MDWSNVPHAMCLHPKDNERLWERLAPTLARVQDAERRRAMLSLGVLAMAPHQAARACFTEALAAERSILNEMSDLRQEASAIQNAFTPEYPLVSITDRIFQREAK